MSKYNRLNIFILGERDPAVRDQREQQQEEEDAAPHWVCGVRSASQHDQAHTSVCSGACE